MQNFEYKVVPAPAKGRKAPGVKGAEARFAFGLEQVMNNLAVDGWEYLRADVLPSEERQGLTSTHTVYRSVLVFRRSLQIQTTSADTEDKPVLVSQAEEPPVASRQEPPPLAPRGMPAFKTQSQAGHGNSQTQLDNTNPAPAVAEQTQPDLISDEPRKSYSRFPNNSKS